MELVAIKIRIGLKANGSALYPNLNTLPSIVASGTDWSYYVDRWGGWHYDKKSGHADDDADSPRGQQWGVLLVPEQCANEAVAAFPDDISMLSESELETFWNERAHVHEPPLIQDAETLRAIEAKERLQGTLPAQRAQQDIDALNPDHPAAGIRRNHRRYWADWKAKRNVTIKAPVR